MGLIAVVIAIVGVDSLSCPGHGQLLHLFPTSIPPLPLHLHQQYTDFEQRLQNCVKEFNITSSPQRALRE